MVDFVCVIPFRRSRDGVEVLLLRRTPADGMGDSFWQPVSGTHPHDEWSPLTALREVREETGLEPLALYGVDAFHRIWLPRQDIIIDAPVFAAELPGGPVTLSEEHVEYRWLAPADALALLPRRSQRAALAAFADDLCAGGRWDEFLLWSRSAGWTRFRPPAGEIDRTF
ncbi:MAG: NUDIX hydrolase [Planctomycetota bacterium]|nr:MAG: NUDIX hydrolase [Planctomycetota bacterium]